MPIPGMGGGSKSMKNASGRTISLRWAFSVIFSIGRPFFKRELQSSSTTSMNALLAAGFMFRTLNPEAHITVFTPGIPFRISVAFPATWSVRAWEVLDGSCTLAKNTPWSSGGMKPAGMMR